jgi:cell division protein FtsX
MSLSVFILSSVLFVKQNTNIIFGDASDLYTVNISVEKTQTPEKIEAILKQIQDVDLQQIKKVTLISSQEQITDVEKVLPAYSSGLFESEELEQILNPMIEVQLAPEANSTEIIEKIKAIPGISNVTFSADWIEKFRSLFSVANIILDTIFVLFFVILSFLIAILIRNYLISAKDSISVQALLGATPRQAFIKPYTQIMLSTLISYVIGLAVTFALALTIKQKISQNTDFSFINTRISFLNISNISIIALGLLLNLVISYWLSYHYINKEYYKHD